MGNCFKPVVDKPTIDIDNEIDGNTTSCCNDEHCWSTCCSFKIVVVRNKNNSL